MFFSAGLENSPDECVCVKFAQCIYTCAYVYLCAISHREQTESCFFTALFGSLWPCHVCANVAAKLAPFSSVPCQPQLHCGTLHSGGNRLRSKRRLVSEQECKKSSLFSSFRFVVINQRYTRLGLHLGMFNRRNAQTNELQPRIFQGSEISSQITQIMTGTLRPSLT